MEREAAIARLKEHEAELKRLGVEHLFLFGSTARGDAREESDVDLFFGCPRGKFGLYELIDVKATAARILGRKADIMTRASIHKALRARRSGRRTGLLMPGRSVPLRRDDMIEAAERYPRGAGRCVA